MICLPGDSVFVVASPDIGGIESSPFAALLVARMPDDAIHEEDERDVCSVLFAGRMNLARFRANVVRPRNEKG